MSYRYEKLFDPGVPVAEIIKTSQQFYDEYGLSELASGLIAGSESQNVNSDAPTKPGTGPIRVAFPAVDIQQHNAVDLIRAMATTSMAGIDEAEQYTEPFAPAEQELDAINIHMRPESAYILSLDPDRFDSELRGLTAPALKKKLASEGFTSLTAFEYIVLQRIMTSYYGDHRFDYYGNTMEDTRWMWLPETTLGDKTFMAYWNPAKKRVELSACRTGSKNPRKGAYLAAITAL